MGNLNIRPYEVSDREAARSLWQDLNRHHGDIYDFPSMGDEESKLGFDKHLARVGPDRIWIAERDGEIVGLTSLIVEEEQAEVEPVVVKDGLRDGGIGRALLDHAIGEARKLGVVYLCVKPVARNTDAIRFFHRADFQALGHMQMLMELGDEETVAWKPGLELHGHPFRY